MWQHWSHSKWSDRPGFRFDPFRTILPDPFLASERRSFSTLLPNYTEALTRWQKINTRKKRICTKDIVAKELYTMRRNFVGIVNCRTDPTVKSHRSRRVWNPRICTASGLPARLRGHADRCSDNALEDQWLPAQIAQAHGINRSELLAIWLPELVLPMGG